MAVMKYNSGLSFVRIAATEVGGSKRRQLVVMGKNGTIEIKPLEIRSETNPTKYSQICKKEECLKLGDEPSSRKQYTSDNFDRYEGMMESFAEMVRGEKSNPYTADYELELFKTILACCGVK